MAACGGPQTVIVPSPGGAITSFAHATTSTTSSPSGTSSPTSTSEAPMGGTGVVDSYGVGWLCRPGVSPDPCTSNLVSLVAEPRASRDFVEPAHPAASSRFDCFYVYPTVSSQAGLNASLAIQPAETAVADEQAARFSQVCKVYAPMYRQVTEAGLLREGLSGGPGTSVAFASLLQGWDDYITHYNNGRPIIFIGHSQGAAMLILLLQRMVETDPSLSKRLVVAIILGGNVQVPIGRTVGGTFSSIPACTAAGQTGCVIAYSSFYGQPPAGSQFGRPGQGVSLMSGQSDVAGLQVLCVNPAALGGGTGALEPYFTGAAVRRRVSEPWVELPDLYTATCASAGGATWLKIGVTRAAGDRRPLVQPTLGANYGLHLYDVNLALGNLVSDVAAAEQAFP
jgi:hypothetical protein